MAVTDIHTKQRCVDAAGSVKPLYWENSRRERGGWGSLACMSCIL